MRILFRAGSSNRRQLAVVCAFVFAAGCGKQQEGTKLTDAAPAPASQERAKPTDTAAPPPPQKSPVAPPDLTSPEGVAPGDEDYSNIKPDFKMTTDEWLRIEGKPDELAKYKNKLIEISSLVKDMSTSDKSYIPSKYDDSEYTSIYLHDADSKFGMGIFVRIKGQNVWKKVLPRQAITVRAKHNFEANRMIGQVISVSGKPCDTLTVDELVKDSKNRSAPFADRDHKWKLVLVGKVASAEKDPSGVDQRMQLVMTPPGSKQPLIVGVATSEQDKQIAAIRAGQTIRVLGALQLDNNSYRFYASAIFEVKD